MINVVNCLIHAVRRYVYYSPWSDYNIMDSSLNFKFRLGTKLNYTQIKYVRQSNTL